ncbi:right-handed parallel beta-helix repeat-containing protein [Saccharomonospora sp. NPDC006951]
MNFRSRGKAGAALFLPTALLLAACTPPAGEPERPPPREESDAAVAAVCDKARQGPAEAPSGAITVDPAVTGDLMNKTRNSPAGTTFWLAPGTHTLGTEQYDQVVPKDGNTYLGAPGAIVDGQRQNLFAFTQPARDVTVKFLTVQNFVAPHDQGVVNHDSGPGWVIEDNTIQHNSGAGMMAGDGQRILRNCLRANGQYGINAYSEGNDIKRLVVEGNEIVGNNTDDWETKRPGCGCTGGVKFWAVNGADVRGNWVHDNRGPGLWADTNNNDFLIEGNIIEDNDNSAIIYETSYNATISGNTIRRNNWADGREFANSGDAFPSATIYLSESGGEPRIPARTDKIDVRDNTFKDNWSGITVWENADRFCNSPANPSGDCTLLVPDAARCTQPGIANAPLYDDCRWKSQRVDIHGNRFDLDPSVVGCASACGRMAILSNFGTYPDWSPYKGEVVQEAITHNQDNRWHDNTYLGPWTFVVYDMSKTVDKLDWQGPAYRQDSGSTFAMSGGG